MAEPKKMGRPRLVMPWFPFSVDYFSNDKIRCYSHACQMVHLYLLKLAPVSTSGDGFVPISKLQPRRIKAFFGHWAGDVTTDEIKAAITEITDRSDGQYLAVVEGDMIAPKDFDQFRESIKNLGVAIKRSDEREGDTLSQQSADKVPQSADKEPLSGHVLSIHEMKSNEMKSDERDPEPASTKIIDTKSLDPRFDSPQLIPGTNAWKLHQRFPDYHEGSCIKTVKELLKYWKTRLNNFDESFEKAISKFSPERDTHEGYGGLHMFMSRELGYDFERQEKQKKWDLERDEKNNPSGKGVLFDIEYGER